MVGLELGSHAAFLRSAAVIPSFQGQGLGTSLVLSALVAAAQVLHYQQLGWLPTEISWRYDLISG